MARKVDESDNKETVIPILTPKEKELVPDALSEARIKHIEDLAIRAGTEIGESFQEYKKRNGL